MGLVKRGDVWWMSFTYQGRRIRQSTGTGNKAMAEAILGKIKADIIEGKFFEVLEEKTRTFDELMDRFLSEHVVKRSSQRAYEGFVKRLKTFFAGRFLADITPRSIAEYKVYRYDSGVKPATINRELAAMKKAFNLAVKEWEWCRANPVCRISLDRENNQRDRWLTDGEEKRLLRAAKPWAREVILFALHTGMRLGEILALTWEGVDLFRRTVTVFRSKNGERRTIPVNHTVLELLKDKARKQPNPLNTVFQSQAGTPIDANNLRRAFRSACGEKKAKIENLHFHDLRHTFATRLVQAGVDLYKVQRLLGHKSPTMTQRYAHHYPESLRDGVEILDRRQVVGTISAQSGRVENGRALQVVEFVEPASGIEPPTC
ncbi:MAG: site-specific integrase [Gaiellales bacterium]|nr:MAG: site-specific integrase [Gaiellales bacterium]